MLSEQIYNDICDIRTSSSTKAKEEILNKYKVSSVFQQILYYTYSPYYRYHIRKIPSEIRGKGDREINSNTWAVLGQLSYRKVTGFAARETLFEHIESLNPFAGELVKMIIAKDLKCGVAVKTINSIFPNLIPEFECQLVEDWNDNKAKYPMLVGPKIDCVRGEYRQGHIFTRKGHKVTGVDHILRYIEGCGPSMDLSGELFIPGMPFSRALGIIRSNKPEKKNVRFAVFDIRSLRTVPYEARLKMLSKTFYPLGTKPLPEVVYIPHYLVHSKDEAAKWFKSWVNIGYEGLVGKSVSATVKDGKTFDWMRMVDGISLELKIINVYESEEVPGTLGGIIVEGGVKVGSGFEDDERLKYWKNPRLILGKYATISAKEKTKAGSLRQPIYKAIRWDI